MVGCVKKACWASGAVSTSVLGDCQRRARFHGALSSPAPTFHPSGLARSQEATRSSRSQPEGMPSITPTVRSSPDTFTVHTTPRRIGAVPLEVPTVMGPADRISAGGSLTKHPASRLWSCSPGDGSDIRGIRKRIPPALSHVPHIQPCSQHAMSVCTPSEHQNSTRSIEICGKLLGTCSVFWRCKDISGPGARNWTVYISIESPYDGLSDDMYAVQ